MNRNRNEQPHSRPIRDNPEPGPIPKAVAVGVLIDVGGTIAGGLVIAFCYALVLGIQGHSEQEIQKALMNVTPWSLLGVALSAMGLLMSALGGYQCAMIANRNNYLAPGILSLVSVAYAASMSEGRTPLPQLLFMIALTVTAILIGAWRHNRRFVPPPANPQVDNQ